MPSEKQSFRASAQARRNALNSKRQHEAAQHIAEQLLVLPEFLAAKTILTYAPLGSELNPNLFLKVLDASNLPMPQLVWPRVDTAGIEARLTLHARAPEDLTPGTFGVREPTADAPTIPLADIDIALVPGCAFDAHNMRMGYGKGYYDRLLADAPTTLLTIGISYRETFFDRIPIEAHDQPLKQVLVG